MIFIPVSLSLIRFVKPQLQFRRSIERNARMTGRAGSKRRVKNLDLGPRRGKDLEIARDLVQDPGIEDQGAEISAAIGNSIL